MEKAITTALLVIASIVAAVALMNAVYPAVTRGTGAILESSGAAAARVRTEVDIVFASGDTSNNKITFWAKNVGTQVVQAVEKSDLFVTTPTTVKRIPYNSGAEYWTYSLEDSATAWSQTKTVKIVVTMTSVTAGLYKVQLIVPNGVQAEKQFSV